MVLDRAIGLPVLMGCAEGGVEIEEVAAKTPEKILKTAVDPDAGLQPFQARRLAFELGFTGEQAPKAEKIMHALAKVFLEKDCSLAEINPLVVMANGEVLALDAKMTFDDNALFRHPDIAALRDESGGGPGRIAGGQVGAELHQPDGQHRLPGQRRRPGDEHDGHHQVSRRLPGQLPRRRRRRQQGAGDRGVPHPAVAIRASRRCW